VQTLDDRSFLAGRAYGSTRESAEAHRRSQDTKRLLLARIQKLEAVAEAARRFGAATKLPNRYWTDQDALREALTALDNPNPEPQPEPGTEREAR
jgi:hypothetical protein